MAVGNRRQIAQRAVEAHVVVPEHIVVEGALQLLQRAEGAASHELRLEYAVGCLGHRVVVGAALAAQRAANAKGLDDPVDALVLKLAAPVRVENGYPIERLALELPLRVFGDNAVFFHHIGDISPRYSPAAERPLDLPRTVAVPAAAEDPYDFVLQLRVAFFLLLRVIACVPADLKQ